jgi:hypothetical protein
MSLGHGPSIVTNGIVNVLDPYYFNGSTSTTVSDRISGTSWTANNFTKGTSTVITTFASAVNAAGTGSSILTVAPNAQLASGSITIIAWFNLKGLPIAPPDANNYWRTFLCPNNAGFSPPVMFILETNGLMSCTAYFTDGVARRNVNNVFGSYTYSTSTWQMFAYTYDQGTGIATTYKNAVVQNQGPQTTGTNAQATTPGLGLSYTGYATNGWQVYGGGISVSTSSGGGGCPGELGNFMTYNRALSAIEIQQNFNAHRGRYGL